MRNLLGKSSPGQKNFSFCLGLMGPAPALLSDCGKYKPQPSEESMTDILPSYSFI